jgi:hypothetical protein
VLPLPAPPLKAAKLHIVQADDRRASDASHAKSTNDRWHAHRRAKGVCQFCAEKWTKDHKCANTIQLHAVQELMELFQVEEDNKFVLSAPEQDDCQLFLSISLAVVDGSRAPKTIYLQGEIQRFSIRVLVDSGSSHTFISQEMAAKLEGVVLVASSLPVQVANGHKLQCQSVLLNALWSVGPYESHSDIKVQELDWLQAFSPMKIHLGQKWMAIPYGGTTVILKGDSSIVPEGTVVQVCSVEVTVDESVQVSIPEEVQELIDRFAKIFQVLTNLPPSRACDHAITLVLGVVPVQVRPYRFAPTLKSEIEKQVKEMLANGLIQKSNSPFSSSVLLVKKKDNSWRFCVDYRHLNGITIKLMNFLMSYLRLVGSLAWTLEQDSTKSESSLGRNIRLPFRPIAATLNLG